MNMYVSPDQIRADFSKAMSAMYQQEVPAYGTLMSLVAQINTQTLDADPVLKQRLQATDSLSRLSEERHGAIRLGTAHELALIRRFFAVMGMCPVGYYDLSQANVPVHSTAFRPIDQESLNRNPFRVFTSLLRLDLIEDEHLRQQAESVLNNRAIFTEGALSLLEKAEQQGGLNADDAHTFVQQLLETFRWHSHAPVSHAFYQQLHDTHRLIADVVSFRGPHINHLTPRTLDIDAAQQRMPQEGIVPKAVVEGPPRRRCPILLRQTSFKALEEAVLFKEGEGVSEGHHTARFGEIEQRGIALTPKGKALYDRLLTQARAEVSPQVDGSNVDEYMTNLEAHFAEFPDTWEAIASQELGYFRYSLTEKGQRWNEGGIDQEQALREGLITADPIVYEDFLPVSAAGIFQSNLGDEQSSEFKATPNQQRFEEDLGAQVLNEFEHYADIQQQSLEVCLAALSGQVESTPSA